MTNLLRSHPGRNKATPRERGQSGQGTESMSLMRQQPNQRESKNVSQHMTAASKSCYDRGHSESRTEVAAVGARAPLPETAIRAVTRVIVTGGIKCRKLETCESLRSPAARLPATVTSRSVLRVSGSQADHVSCRSTNLRNSPSVCLSPISPRSR